jgi:hypothetical protein
MKLPIYQTLQQHVAAHNEGNVQQAERLYRYIFEGICKIINAVNDNNSI